MLHLHLRYGHCRFWQSIFGCSVKGNEVYSEACERGQTFADSGYMLSDTLTFAMKSAQAVIAINDFIEKNYCQQSSSPAPFSFQVRQSDWVKIWMHEPRQSLAPIFKSGVMCYLYRDMQLQTQIVFHLDRLHAIILPSSYVRQ